jgi:hypothetical protein
MGGQPKSDAWGEMSRAVRRSAQEPTDAIPQNQRDAARILFTLGRRGCQSDYCCVRFLYVDRLRRSASEKRPAHRGTRARRSRQRRALCDRRWQGNDKS